MLNTQLPFQRTNVPAKLPFVCRAVFRAVPFILDFDHLRPSHQLVQCCSGLLQLSFQKRTTG
jgi:hypothetical protein